MGMNCPTIKGDRQHSRGLQLVLDAKGIRVEIGGSLESLLRFFRDLVRFQRSPRSRATSRGQPPSCYRSAWRLSL
jgi:hypothetical protein